MMNGESAHSTLDRWTGPLSRIRSPQLVNVNVRRTTAEKIDAVLCSPGGRNDPDR